MIPWHEIIRLQALLLGVALVAIGYGLFVKRLANVVQPLRLRLAERGEKYLAICKNPKERSVVRFYLDHAFNPWVCIVASVALPVAWVLQIFCATEETKNEDRDEYRRIAALFAFSAFSANPLFGVIVALEILIAIIIMVIIKGQIDAVVRAVAVVSERIADKAPRHQTATQH